MSDLGPPKLLLTTSVILAAIFENGDRSPSRSLLKMGENRLANLWASSDLIAQTERLLRNRASGDEQWKNAAAGVVKQLVISHVGTSPPPSQTMVDECREFTLHEASARIIATAIEQDCEMLVASSEVELLKNRRIGPPNTRFLVMDSHSAFDWALDQAITRSRLRRDG